MNELSGPMLVWRRVVPAGLELVKVFDPGNLLGADKPETKEEES